MLLTAVALASSLSSTVADTVPGRCLGTSAAIHQSVASGLTDSAPKALHFLQERGVLILAVVAALVVVAVVASRLQMRRELASRVRFAVIPTESFDPSADEILRFAAGLSRTRRVVRRLGAGRTDAIRLRLVAVAGGRVVQLLEGPRRSLSILRNAGFDQVDLRPPEAVPGLFPPGPDRSDRPRAPKPKAGSLSSLRRRPGPSDDGRSTAASVSPAGEER
ncbi:MAG TPA: hypothetical protein VM390_05840 [Acidimicrobiales bacterium]|nr:hypothetical protein [Acidimicrobiales bacterium]